jgi:RNA polymerase sigma factor (sigma-70 family)
MDVSNARGKCERYLDLLRLARVKKDVLNAAKENADSLSGTSFAQKFAGSSPPLCTLTVVERAADRTLRYEQEYSEQCEELFDAEEELNSIIEVLPPREKTLIIERYKKGETLSSIGRKYGYTRDYVKVKFHRIFNKIKKIELDNQ